METRENPETITKWEVSPIFFASKSHVRYGIISRIVLFALNMTHHIWFSHSFDTLELRAMFDRYILWEDQSCLTKLLPSCAVLSKESKK